ncbi:hypothetical protein [Nocardia sp. NPDC052566]|uniref:hypothetical protein n=1 Tax=Nocardia sp. NPDC052566 TaxID=3364330 RepID=UPI0037CB74E7
MIATILAPLMWLAAATRAWRWWWSRSWVLGSTTVALAVVGLHLTLNIPAAEALTQAIEPIPNFSTALRMVLFNLMAASTGTLMLAITNEPARVAKGARWLAGIAAAGSVAALTIFVATPPVPRAAGGFEFDQAYSHLPGYAEAGIAGALFPALLCPALMVIASRAADVRTVTGWSLTLLSAGLAAATTWAWLRLTYFLHVRYGDAAPHPALFEATRAIAAAGVLVIFVGMMLSPIVSWVRARRVMHAIGPLRAELVTRRPEVLRPSRRGCSADEKASDRITELLDALSLETADFDTAESSPEVAAALADWLVHGERSNTVRRANIRTTDDHRWALSLAHAYRHSKRKALA